MTECNSLFCVLEAHSDDLHMDATGYTWHEPTPANPVIAHVYDVDPRETMFTRYAETPDWDES